MWNVAADQFRKLAEKQRKSLHKWTMTFYSESCPFINLFFVSWGINKGPHKDKKCKQSDYNVNSKASLQHLNLQFYTIVFNSKD